MAIHSSIFAWRIPGTEEPGGLPSMVSHRVRYDRSNLAVAAAAAPEAMRHRVPHPLHLTGICAIISGDSSILKADSLSKSLGS